VKEPFPSTMTRVASVSFLVLLFLHTFSFDQTSATEYDNRGRFEDEATLDADGDVTFSTNSQAPPDPELIHRLIENSGADSFVISEDVATNIATVITAAKSDPETSLLLLRMKQQGGKESFDAFRRGLTPDLIVSGLAEAVSEMQMAEILFQDPVRAFIEMEKDGMIPADKIKMYKKNPELLIQDTRKSLYFTVVSLAAAGGYL
jgi:hypothetical protein